MRSGGRLRTYGRINARSAKNIERQPDRDEVRATTKARAGGVCQMAELIPEIPCFGPADDVHEIEGRGVNPGAQYDDTITMLGCRGHHAWVTREPKLAEERGLRQRSTFELRGGARRMR